MAIDPQLEQAFQEAQVDVRTNGLKADLRSVVLTGLAYLREGQDDTLARMGEYYGTLHGQLNKLEAKPPKRKRVRDSAVPGAIGAVLMGALLALAEWVKTTWGS